MEDKYINTSSTQWGSYASDHDGASPRCDINPNADACPVWQENSLPLQLNSGNTIILTFSVNPTNALTISLTGCPSYPCVGAKASRGGCDEGITERTPERTEPPTPTLQLCRYAAYHRGHQQKLVLNTNLLASGNREVHPPQVLTRPLFKSHYEKESKQVKREIHGADGLGLCPSSRASPPPKALSIDN